MASTARQFYLQLYFDVFDDPLVASLSQTYQLAFVKLLMQALRSETLGVIKLPLPALTRALGWRKVERTEAFLEEIEGRLLIGFRKQDEAIVVAARLLPQLSQPADAEPLPERRNTKPSADKDRVKVRVDNHRANKKAAAAQTSADLDPLEDFMDALDPGVTPPCNAPESLGETPHYSKESTEEKSTETTTTSRGGVTTSAPKAEKAVVVASDALRAALVDAGVTETIAKDLIRVHGAERCRRQVEYWPYNQAAKNPINPGGMLRRAIDEDWAPPQAWRDAEAARRQTAAAEAQRQKAQEERDRREAQAAIEEQVRLSWCAEQTPAVQAEIEAAARERMLPNAREKLQTDEAAGRPLGNLSRTALETARRAVISERMATDQTQDGDGLNTSQKGQDDR